MSSNANTAIIQAFSLEGTRTGWKQEEENLLFEEAAKAQEENRPLKSVFDIVALKTGRKPNSIRNYYYARIKENPQCHQRSPAFIPFRQEEIWDLLVNVLSEQARGVSVRACTLKMGRGDTKAMLRYQNKYRSLIRTNEPLVREVVRYMKENNMPCIDPYEDLPSGCRRVGRPRKEDPREISLQTLLGSISQLARLAEEGAQAKARLAELEAQLQQSSLYEHASLD
jgi:hypothetical protein